MADTDADYEDGDFDVGPEATQRLLEEDPSGVLLAVVKKGLKDKNGNKGGGKRGDKCGKGCGKGEKRGGKKGGPRACFECGAEDHLANACPVRLERVAAGGPERLPRDDAMKGGKKGGGGKGGKEAWKGYGAKGYTFIPSAGQWRALLDRLECFYLGRGSGRTRCSLEVERASRGARSSRPGTCSPCAARSSRSFWT